MAFEDNAGTNRLARVLSGRMKQEGRSPLILDFGRINGDFSLTTNTYPVQIPQGQYSLCKGLAERAIPGDRVLVGWVFNEAVIIDVIFSSANL